MIIYSPSETLKHLSEAMKYSFRCDQQKMLAGRKVAVRMTSLHHYRQNGYHDQDQDAFMTKAIDKNQTWLPT